MPFLPQLWGQKTANSMLDAQKEGVKLYKTLTDYTTLVLNKAATAYNGPRIGTLQAYDMPLADDKFTKPDNSAIEINFDKKVGVPFLLDDVDAAQSNLKLLTEYTTGARKGLEKEYDKKLLDALIVNTKAAHIKDFSSGGVLSYADIVTARKLLNAAGAPMTGRYLAAGAEMESALFGIDEFKDASKFSEGILPKGVVGMVLGFFVVPLETEIMVDANGVATATRDKKAVSFYQSLALGWGRQQEFKAKIEPKAGAAADMVNIYSVLGYAKQEDGFSVTFKEPAA